MPRRRKLTADAAAVQELRDQLQRLWRRNFPGSTGSQLSLAVADAQIALAKVRDMLNAVAP